MSLYSNEDRVKHSQAREQDGTIVDTHTFGAAKLTQETRPDGSIRTSLRETTTGLLHERIDGPGNSHLERNELAPGFSLVSYTAPASVRRMVREQMRAGFDEFIKRKGNEDKGVAES